MQNIGINYVEYFLCALHITSQESLKERGSPRRGLARDHAQKACDHWAKGYEGMRRSQSADPSHYLKVKLPF